MGVIQRGDQATSALELGQQEPHKAQQRQMASSWHLVSWERSNPLQEEKTELAGFRAALQGMSCWRTV